MNIFWILMSLVHFALSALSDQTLKLTHKEPIIFEDPSTIIKTAFDGWIEEYPEMFTSYSISENLHVIQIGFNQDNITVPNIKLIGGIHGNELVGPNILMHLIEKIISLVYEKNDSEMISLLYSINIHVLPLMNPEGSVKAQNGLCTSGPGRNNANNVDLNRNFPSSVWPSDVGQPEKETVAVMKWMMERHFVLSMSLHSGALGVIYPYDVSKTKKFKKEESLTDDDEEFKYLANQYVSLHPWMKSSRGCNQLPPFNNGIINGAQWLPAIGTMQDYNYDFHGCLELTVEVDCCKTPKNEDRDKIVNENLEPILDFIKHADRGIKGLVTYNKEPVEGATVTIMSRSIEHKTTSKGEFWRFLLPGHYYLKIEKDGFETVIRSFILSEDQFKSAPLKIDIELKLKSHAAIEPEYSEQATDEEEPATTPRALHNENYNEYYDPIHLLDEDEDFIQVPQASSSTKIMISPFLLWIIIQIN